MNINLIFHGVSDDDTPRRRHMPIKQFHWLINYFKGYIISMEDAFKGKRGITISFDDCYHSSVEHVIDLNIPLTFFVCRSIYNEPDVKLLTDDDIRLLSRKFEIGSHTITHQSCALCFTEAIDEFHRSKELLNSITGKNIRYIAFPYGEYDHSVKEIASIFYEGLLGCDYLLPEDKNDPRILNRFCISNTTSKYINFLAIYIKNYFNLNLNKLK